MEIIIGKTSGFCHGVKNAVDEANQELESCQKELYCLGELVHNKQVVNKLREKGLKFIENIEEAREKVIIRAHGVAKEIYEKAENLKIEIKDLTCPKVLNIHNLAEEYSKKGYYIFLVGIANHPETIGTYSFCGKNSTIIENISEVEEAIQKMKTSKIKKAFLICQTTFNLKKFEEISKKLNEILREENIELKVINTICSSTELRQKETEELSQKVELMLIIGGKNSSNTNKLYDIANKNCKNVIFAETEADIDINHVKNFKKIGIMAGASTPKDSIESIVELIKKEEI